jgi:hypothetical protein
MDAEVKLRSAPAGPRSPTPSGRVSSRLRNGVAIAGLAILVALAIGFTVLVRHWPFTQSALEAALAQTVPGKVQIASLRRTYFPSPGCVAEGVVITGNAAESGPVRVTIQRLTVHTGFLDVFRNTIQEVRAEGLQVMVPPGTGLSSGGGQSQSSPPSRVVRHFVADGAVVEFERNGDDSGSLRFQISQLSLSQDGPGSPVSFKSVLQNPEPPGVITSEGEFGPWKADDPGSTALSGWYRFENARLDVFDGIAGTLSSRGKFSGDLAHVKVEGTTATPDFELKRAGHRVKLNTRFSAVVDGVSGDTVLQSLQAQIGDTAIDSHANVKQQPSGAGKLTSVSGGGRGRVQDLLRLVSQDSPPALSGPVNFKAAVKFAPASGEFLKNVEVDGDFNIEGVRFSRPATQTGVNSLSARAQGKKVKQPAYAPEVDGDLQSHVVLKRGVATFSGLTFTAPGATAELSGTYNVVTERVNLRGNLRTKASLSHDTSGVKAILLKPLNPIFKKKSAGAVVGVSITGSYDKPSFGIDLPSGK